MKQDDFIAHEACHSDVEGPQHRPGLLFSRLLSLARQWALAPALAAENMAPDRRRAGGPGWDETLGHQDMPCQAILDASPDCLELVDLSGRLLFLNKTARRSMGIADASALVGRQWAQLWRDPPPARVADALAAARTESPSRFSGVRQTMNGDENSWDVVIIPVRARTGRTIAALATAREVAPEFPHVNPIGFADQQDPLTGMPDRRAFECHLQTATLRAMRSGHEVSLLLIDIDRFKHVNEMYGHAAGDQVLATIASNLKCCHRGGQFLARIDGDTFAVIIEGCGEARGWTKAKVFNQVIKQPTTLAADAVSVGCSIGVAVFPADADNASDLLKNAEIALHVMKKNGRGGVQMYCPQMRGEAQVAAEQLNRARVAVCAQTVVPHYQQKVDLRSGSVIGFEALLRWHHASRGLQLPSTVAEAFKDYELAVKIGDLMQRSVFNDMRRWMAEGIGTGVVAINAAPAEFLRDDFAEQTIRRLREFDLPASLIEIEVTEHAFLEEGYLHIVRALRLLNEAGVRVALDDFGTGYSSLSHLRDFPVDVVKIDQTFVERITFDPQARAIVSAVIDLADSLGISVIAEGIETELQRALLRKMGCAVGQGYFFGVPVARDAVPRLLARGTSQKAA